MPPFVTRSLDWLRRQVGWSNSPQSWAERLGLLAWVGAAFAVGWFYDSLSAPQLVGLGGALLLGLAFLVRRGWVKLFGPVLFYDLVRLARRRWGIFFRILYAVALALVLTWLYGIWSEDMKLRYGYRVPTHEQAEFAETFFYVFMTIQFIAVALLTPAYTAGAIAEEKERRTLEFLLATDLRNREIIFGKLAARVGNLALFLLTGLPILSLIQFFGGVDPDLVLAGFAATLVTMLSLSALGIFASVVSKRARDAIVLTYLMAVGYTVLTLVLQALLVYPWATSPANFLGYTVTTADAIDVVSSGNLILALREVTFASVMAGGPVRAVLTQVLAGYATFHGVVIALCVGYAVWRLRATALRESYGTTRRARKGRRAAPRPDVGESPVVWKEVCVESGLRMNRLARLVLLQQFGLTMAPLAIILWDVFVWRQYANVWEPDLWRRLGEGLNEWVRAVGTPVTCLLLLGIAVRGAGSVVGERDRQTLDSLLTAPLSSREILWGKWWGCMLGLRAGWLWLAIIWAAGLAGGGLHPAALPGLMLATFVYAGTFAWLGIFFSTCSRTTLRATMATVFFALLLGGGYLMVLGL